MNENSKPPSANWKSFYRSLLKSFQRDPDDKQQLTEILRDAEKQNLINPDTLVMMEGALIVSDMRVRDIMVPRSQMVVVQDDMEFQDLLPAIIESGHSRFPMLDGKLENVVGILLAKDMLAYLADEGTDNFNVRDILRPPIFVPESKRLNVLLSEFRRSRNHMAMVVDEYGGVSGLVTIEDVIEQIVGEIDDEHDLDDEEFVRSHRHDRYTVKAHMPIEEFNRFFNADLSDEDHDTIGGAVIDAFGHLPLRGETIELAGFGISILRADRRRVLTLRLQPLQPTRDDASTNDVND